MPLYAMSSSGLSHHCCPSNPAAMAGLILGANLQALMLHQGRDLPLSPCCQHTDHPRTIAKQGFLNATKALQILFCGNQPHGFSPQISLSMHKKHYKAHKKDYTLQRAYMRCMHTVMLTPCASKTMLKDTHNNASSFQLKLILTSKHLPN